MKMPEITAVLLAGAMLGFLPWFLLGGWAGAADMRRDAIQHNAGHYDARSGDFQWGAP